jgi:amino acid transporter
MIQTNSKPEKMEDGLTPTQSRDGVGEVLPQNELRRDFKPRQVFMFSIACAIGTGLVIGSGTALSRGGPASLLISYLVIGTVVFFVMTALGEMAAFLPMNKGFGGYATRIVDPAFGYDFPCTGHEKVEAYAFTDLLPGGTTSSNTSSRPLPTLLLLALSFDTGGLI